MDASLALSALGLVFTAYINSPTEPNVQGIKTCDFGMIGVVYKDPQTIYVRNRNSIYQLHLVQDSFTTKRFTSANNTFSYVQFPNKSMLLNNVTQQVIFNDCVDTETENMPW